MGKISVILEWKDGDFFVVEKLNEEKISLMIDEETEKIHYVVPKGTPIVTRRTVDRRVKSIAKSGFEVSSNGLRIGAKYELIESEADEIPDILLQVGHAYKKPEDFGTIKPTITKEDAVTETIEKFPPISHSSKKKSIKKTSEVKSSEESQESESPMPVKSPTKSKEIHSSTINSNIPFFTIIDTFLGDGEVLLTKNPSSYVLKTYNGSVEFEVTGTGINILSSYQSSKSNVDFADKVETIKKALEK